MTSVTLSFKSLVGKLSESDLERLCQENPDARLEIDTQGKLIAMSPTGSESGRRNMSLAAQVWNWNSQTKLGIAFDSSTGFKLANGAIRSPDVSWVTLAKWNSLSKEQKRKFAPIDPDFVIELMSPICEAVSFRTDDRDELRRKMQEYQECGVRLGWLIDPDAKEVEIYRGSQSGVEILENPQSLFEEEILPELIVDLKEIFA